MTVEGDEDTLGQQQDASLHAGLVMFLEISARSQVTAGVRDTADYDEGLRLLRSLKARFRTW